MKQAKGILVTAAIVVSAAALLMTAAAASSYPVSSPADRLATTRAELIALRGTLTTPTGRLWLSRSVASLGWAVNADCWPETGEWPTGLTAGRCWDAIKLTVNRLTNGDPSGELAAKARPQILEILDVTRGIASSAWNMASSFMFLSEPGGPLRQWQIQHDIERGDQDLARDLRWAFNDYLRAWFRWAAPLEMTPSIAFGAELVQPKLDSNPGGSAEAFQVQAGGSALSRISLYVDPASTATTLVAGIYADGQGGAGQLLAQGSTPLAQGGGDWNTVHIPGVALNPGSTYWLAILTPAGGGTLRFRDRCCRGGGTSFTVMSQETNLTTLPASWSSGRQFKDGPLSVFGSN